MPIFVVLGFPDLSGVLVIRSESEVEHYMDVLRGAATKAQGWMAAFTGDPLDLLRHLKFDAVGFHPMEGRPINFIEQLNQTWTYAVALAATRKLLELHPEAEGFKVAPGAHKALPLDIMSVREGLVGAETFAAISPRNNRKLALDLAKMRSRSEQHRYIFLCSPQHRGLRLTELGTAEVQVWSVEVH